jgi:predicted transcriptional regulator
MSREKIINNITASLKGLKEGELKEVLALVERMRAEGEEISLAPAISGEVEVKPLTNGNANIKMRGTDIYFASSDIEKIQHLALESDKETPAQQAVYSWFAGNRIDIINNAQITGPADSIILDLLRGLKITL